MIATINGVPLDVVDFVPFCHSGCAVASNECSVEIILQSHPRKAVAFRRTQSIIIDPRFWDSLSLTGRIAVIGHELAHIMGADCERCADFYAGRLIAYCAFDEGEAFEAFRSLSRRSDYSAFVEGLTNGRQF